MNIEPSVSKSTQIKRQIRYAILPRLLAFYIFCIEVGRRCERFLNQHTSLVGWYSAAQRQRDFFEWRLRRWASEHEELGRMIVALIIIAIILFVVMFMEGYVDSRSTERAGRWMAMRVGTAG